LLNIIYYSYYNIKFYTYNINIIYVIIINIMIKVKVNIHQTRAIIIIFSQKTFSPLESGECTQQLHFISRVCHMAWVLYRNIINIAMLRIRIRLYSIHFNNNKLKIFNMRENIIQTLRAIRNSPPLLPLLLFLFSPPTQL
jgi:hypothetical protein